MKKVVLVSTFCDTDEKQNVLKETVEKIKSIGLDIMVISPNTIHIKQEIIDKCDFFFYTKENPILKWPIRSFTMWKEFSLPDGRVTTLHRGLGDYGWAALYQVKKLTQFALTFGYDIFYHLIYDLEIDEQVLTELKENDVNIIHPRIKPSTNETWRASLHFMIFDKEMMERIEREISYEKYVSKNGVAEDEVSNWVDKFNLKLSTHQVKDRIYFGQDYDFFNYSPFEDFKLFVSKNETITIWLGYQKPYPQELSENLKLVFHSFDEIGSIEVDIDGKYFSLNPKNYEIIELPIDSQKIEKFKIKYNHQDYDFSKDYKKILMNQIYYNHRS